ncbi:glycosyltransferase [Haladaptatus salinisoli]|uniref:glycosyltransferase n=1 Tax=Haladaptatus salinisoli TaxID=2884876 RepID=UPI001D0B5BAA|nr:glycosyltransferase [Haladaptatus salinisoli]
MKRPSVSIVTAAYDAEKHVERALRSVRRQTVDAARIEHVVVDDGSTDGTAAIVEEFDASYLRLVQNERNSGDGTIACNRGIEEARGEYLVVLDADDEFLPSLVERQSDILAAEPGIDFVYSDYYERFPDGERVRVDTGANVLNTVKVGTMHRTEQLREFGLYDPEMIFAEYDLLLRYLDAGLDGYHVAEPLFVYHRRRGSVTSDGARVEAGREELRAKHGRELRIRDYEF